MTLLVQFILSTLFLFNISAMGQMFSTEVPKLSGTSKFATVNNITLHYVEHAKDGFRDEQKPVLLCLHGFTSQAHSFDRLAENERLLDKFRVVALDMRGHGSSDWADSYLPNDFVQDIDAFVDHLGVDGVYMLGMSLGGIVAVTYAGQFPEKVKALMLGDIAPGISMEAIQRTMADDPSPESFASLDAAVEFASKGFSWPNVDNNGLRNDLALRLNPVVGENGSESYIWRADLSIYNSLPIMLQQEASRWQALGNTSCKILTLRGIDSPFVSDEIKNKIESVHSGAKVVTVPGAGHCILADNLDGFLNEALPFLESQL